MDICYDAYKLYLAATLEHFKRLLRDNYVRVVALRLIYR